MPIRTCPTCGSKRLRRRVMDIEFPVRGKTYVVPAVEVEVCPNCGEKLFDQAAMRIVEQYIPSHRRRVKARKL